MSVSPALSPLSDLNAGAHYLLPPAGRPGTCIHPTQEGRPGVVVRDCPFCIPSWWPHRLVSHASHACRSLVCPTPWWNLTGPQRWNPAGHLPLPLLEPPFFQLPPVQGIRQPSQVEMDLWNRMKTFVFKSMKIVPQWNSKNPREPAL